MLKKASKILIILGFMIVITLNVYAYNIVCTSENEDNTILITLKIVDISDENGIDVYQGKLNYNSEEFETVDESNFELLNGWYGLVYNKQNGMFIIEKDEKVTNNEEFLKIKLVTKENIDENNIEVSVTNNVVSGGIDDINLKDVTVNIDIKNSDKENNDNNKNENVEQNKELGYEIENQIITFIKVKTPVEDFKNILLNGNNYTVKVFDNNKEVTTGYMKTGMKIQIIDEENNISNYKASVIGDINCDGLVNVIDTKMIKAYRSEILNLSEEQKKSADINNDSKIDKTDSKLLLYHRAAVNGYDLNYTK